MLGDTVNVSAKECNANEFSNRSYNKDTLFFGGNITDNGRVKYMEYKHHEEELNIVSNVTIETGSTLTGELVDTSDKTKKYDIKDAENNFTDIIKSIKPKTFKMLDEKEKGINRNHIRFVADVLFDVIPDEWENIIYENKHKIKQLNYVKLNAVLWGVCREQQNKIEHLEASVYELQAALKDYIKPKPKTKPKSRPKVKDNLVEF